MIAYMRNKQDRQNIFEAVAQSKEDGPITVTVEDMTAKVFYPSFVIWVNGKLGEQHVESFRERDKALAAAASLVRTIEKGGVHE